MITAFGTYITRYSAFDALQGEIGDDRYLQLTSMAPAERVAVMAGLALVLLAVVLLLGAAMGRSRTRG